MLLFLDREDDVHADWVEAECQRRGVPYFRFVTEKFPSEIALSIQLDKDVMSGMIQTAHEKIDIDDIVGIWFRRPDRPKAHPQMDPAYVRFAEMESMATLQGLFRALWDRRWVNPVHTAEAARHKIHQLRLAAKLGFTTVPTIITNDADEARAFFEQCNGRIIYKTLRQVSVAYTDAAYGIYTSIVTQEQLDEHLDSIHFIPCLFQEYVPKQYELRINVIGNYVWAAAIHSQGADHTQLDFRYNTADCPHTPIILPWRLEQMCLALVHALGLRMGNIDIIVTPDGDYVFLEINPNGQWAWVERMAGLPLCTALVDELLGIDTLAKHPYIKDRSLHFPPTPLTNVTAPPVI